MTRKPGKIAFIGNYLPRRCGIATFTTDLCEALGTELPSGTLSVVAMNDTLEGYRYPPRVRFQITQNRISEYRSAAEFLNMTNYEIVSVQHEFGIYGGPAGSHLLVLLRELRMPIVTTLHTVLAEPDPDQRKVMSELARLSDRLVVMSGKAVSFLKDVYGVPEERIAFIPHGVPDLPFVDPNFYKDLFGVEGRKVLLSFGLLSPDKGFENVLRALPEVVKAHRDVVYIVLGATHPQVLRQRGEEYRFFLQGLVRSLGLDDHVVFHDRFVEPEELHAFVGSADVCITPYLNPAQVTSGVLSLGVGCGKAMVSTPFWHAQEMLAEGRGVLVPFGESAPLADALLRLFDNEPERHAMRKRAYTFGREMIWREVARRYLELFDRVVEERRREPRRMPRAAGPIRFVEEVPAPDFGHLKRMTDSAGILQHAKYTIPDRAHGYCTDDNARALVAAVRGRRLFGEEARELEELAAIYLSFIDHAFIPEKGRFHNFLSWDRRWLDEEGSEDCQGRALWGLGAAAARGEEPGLVAVATRLFVAALPAARRLQSPRAVALSVIGIHEYLRRFSGDVEARRVREELALWLLERFRRYGSDDWPWPEETLSYANARLPQALFLSGQWMQRQDMVDEALRALRFLMSVQKSPEGHFEPVGSNGGYTRGGVKARFDQQPVEAEATLEACVEAWHVTGDAKWLDEARICYEWFLGRNDLGVSLYDHASGGCRDGLHPDRANQNEGAESTLAWLLSAITMEEIKAEVGGVERQSPA